MINISNLDHESLTPYRGTELKPFKSSAYIGLANALQRLSSVRFQELQICPARWNFQKVFSKTSHSSLCMHTSFLTIPLGNQMFTSCGNSQCNLNPLGTWLVFSPQLFGPLCCHTFIEAHCNFQMKCSTLMVIIIMTLMVFATSLSPSLLSFYSLTVLLGKTTH